MSLGLPDWPLLMCLTMMFLLRQHQLFAHKLDLITSPISLEVKDGETITKSYGLETLVLEP